MCALNFYLALGDYGQYLLGNQNIQKLLSALDELTREESLIVAATTLAVTSDTSSKVKRMYGIVEGVSRDVYGRKSCYPSLKTDQISYLYTAVRSNAKVIEAKEDQILNLQSRYRLPLMVVFFISSNSRQGRSRLA